MFYAKFELLQGKHPPIPSCHCIQVHIVLVCPLGRNIRLAFRLFYAGSQTYLIILVALLWQGSLPQTY